MKPFKLTSGIVILAVALLLAPMSAIADITYILAVPDTNGFALHTDTTPPPYGTVRVHFIDPTDATITFTAPGTTYVPANRTTYTDYYSFIGTSMLGVNINGGTSNGDNVSYSNLKAYDHLGNLQSATITRASGANNVDGFGKMNLVFNGPNFGSGYDIDKVIFNVHITGASWFDDAHVLANNNKLYKTGAHLVADIPGSPGFPTNGPALTGYGGNTTGTQHAPIPGSVLLLGSGLVGVGLLRYRQRHKS
jgi:hypothetical protein